MFFKISRFGGTILLRRFIVNTYWAMVGSLVNAKLSFSDKIVPLLEAAHDA
jgi:hypothetical protein